MTRSLSEHGIAEQGRQGQGHEMGGRDSNTSLHPNAATQWPPGHFIPGGFGKPSEMHPRVIRWVSQGETSVC